MNTAPLTYTVRHANGPRANVDNLPLVLLYVTGTSGGANTHFATSRFQGMGSRPGMIKRATPADVASWLRQETPEHLALMTRLRERLASTVDTDITENGAPSRDWCRALSRYQGSYTVLLQEERERFKIRLAMNKAGEGLLSEDEYEKELGVLAVESLGTLPADALHRELERRALSAGPQPNDKDDIDDD